VPCTRRPTPAPRRSLLARCPETPEPVFGFDRNQCSDSVGILTLTGRGPKVSDFLGTWESPYGEFVGRTLGNVSVARRRLRCENAYLRLELHTDGAGWARYLTGSSVPGRGVLVVQLEQLEAYITEMLTLLGTYSSWTGAAGDCAISARLYGKVLGEIALRSGQRPRVTWQHAWPHEPSETTAALDQLALSRQQAGIIAYPLARDLEQDMGVPEPVSLRPDGKLIPHLITRIRQQDPAQTRNVRAESTAARRTGGCSTLKWPHCSLLIWPHPGRSQRGCCTLIWPRLAAWPADLCDTPEWLRGRRDVWVDC